MATFPTARAALLGHPATPGYTPGKRDLISVLEQIEGMATSGIKGYHATLAALTADASPAPGAGDYRIVISAEAEGGVYRYSGSAWLSVAPLPSSLQNIADEAALAAAVALSQAWASGTEPGGAGTQSAREWAEAAEAAESTIVKPQGAWAATTPYALGDLVRPGTPAGQYIARVAHTSGADFADDLAAGRWELFLADGAVGDVPGARLIASGAGLTGGGDLTANRTLALTGQALALHALGSNGIVARTGAGTVAARMIAAAPGITVTNGDGVSGHPTLTPVSHDTAIWEAGESAAIAMLSPAQLAAAVAATAPTGGFVDFLPTHIAGIEGTSVLANALTFPDATPRNILIVLGSNSHGGGVTGEVSGVTLDGVAAPIVARTSGARSSMAFAIATVVPNGANQATIAFTLTASAGAGSVYLHCFALPGLAPLTQGAVTVNASGGDQQAMTALTVVSPMQHSIVTARVISNPTATSWTVPAPTGMIIAHATSLFVLAFKKTTARADVTTDAGKSATSWGCMLTVPMGPAVAII